jgi:intracellular multiplication protein IcmP
MSEQNNKDSTNDIIYLFVGVILAIGVIYYFFGKEIIYGYLTLKLWELKIINLIYPTEANTYYIQRIQEKSITTWKLKDVLFIGKHVGFVVNIFLGSIIAILSYNMWKKNPAQKFKRELNIKTLKESEQVLWPYIAPVVNIDLIKESLETGPYAMAMTPYAFAVKYKLLADEKNIGSLNKTRTEKLFISQLNKLWTGIDSLKKHEKALFLIFAAHGCGDKKGAMNAINSIAISSAENQKKMPDFSSTKPLEKYLDDERVKTIITKHAYIYTILAQMIEFARNTGVFPPSYFLWLKPRDRLLWYTLNCVGRQVSFVEVAGIFSHWKAEQTAGHKIEAPFVSEAVKGLEKALAEVKIV